MANQDNTSSTNWERIQKGVSEIEKLIGQKRYNMAMVQSRQTLEFMVKCLCEKYDIEESALIDRIDALFECGVISKTTCEHYHKIRTIGNKAIHEDDNSAYNANQAHHLLSQEVYAFSSELNSSKKRVRRETSDAGARNAGSSSRSARSSGRRSPAHRNGGSGAFDIGSLIKPLALVIVIIILLWVIKFINSPGDNKPAETSTEAAVETTAEAVVETEPEEPEVLGIYRVTDTVNVRPEPNTDKDRIGQLMENTEVKVLRDYDDKWCVIEYQGGEAYIAKQYLEFVQ